MQLKYITKGYWKGSIELQAGGQVVSRKNNPDGSANYSGTLDIDDDKPVNIVLGNVRECENFSVKIEMNIEPPK